MNTVAGEESYTEEKDPPIESDTLNGPLADKDVISNRNMRTLTKPHTDNCKAFCTDSSAADKVDTKSTHLNKSFLSYPFNK